jgi:hypothetical protein
LQGCLPLALEVGVLAEPAESLGQLGAQVGETAIRQVAGQAGFTRFRRAAETPFNAVFEARP